MNANPVFKEEPLAAMRQVVWNQHQLHSLIESRLFFWMTRKRGCQVLIDIAENKKNIMRQKAVFEQYSGGLVHRFFDFGWRLDSRRCKTSLQRRTMH